MRFGLIILLAAVLAGLTPDNGPTYKTTTAKNGDGIFSLLRRYQLLNSEENINKFYELNSLRPGDHLVKGKQYKLPVLLYVYDGTSIRTTIGIEDYDVAKRIEAYNLSLLNLGIVNSSFKESKELWVPMHTLRETTGTPVTDEMPTVMHSRVIEAPIFGEKYSNVEVTSELLKGEVFYIISGHGGPDPGAMSETRGHTLCEDEYAYDVSLRLARKLMEHGAAVEMVVQDLDDGIRDNELLVCDKDEKSMGRTAIPIRQLIRLQQRTHEVNQLYHKYRAEGVKDQTVVCVHVDSRSPKSRQDVFFYYCEGSKTGKRMAYDLQKTFKEKYEMYRPGRNYSGTVSSRGLYVLRHTDPPAVYIELANIRNDQDRKRILPRDNRQALANWIFEGLTR